VRLARIATERDAATNLLQQLGGLLHTRPGHVRVGVARAEKNWRAARSPISLIGASGGPMSSPMRASSATYLCGFRPTNSVVRQAPSLSADGIGSQAGSDISRNLSIAPSSIPVLSDNPRRES
jgi:hypothetical protein